MLGERAGGVVALALALLGAAATVADAQCKMPDCSCAPGVSADHCAVKCTIPTAYGKERDCGFPGVTADACKACHPQGPDPARCKAIGCCYGGGSATVPSCFFGNGQWPPSRAGVSFVAVVAVVALGYVVGGVAYGSRAGGTPASIRAHPHYGRWQQLAGLAADGVATVRQGGGPGKRQYAKVPVVGAEPEGRAGGGKKKGKLQPKEIFKEKNASRRSDEQAVGARGGTGAAAAPSSAGDPAAVALAPGTAAGGGGRWVHVPT